MEYFVAIKMLIMKYIKQYEIFDMEKMTRSL